MFLFLMIEKKFLKLILQADPLNKIKPNIMLRKTRGRYIGRHVPTLTLKLNITKVTPPLRHKPRTSSAQSPPTVHTIPPKNRSNCNHRTGDNHNNTHSYNTTNRAYQN